MASKWSPKDARASLNLFMIHFICLLAPFHFNWAAFWVAFVLVLLTGLLGIMFSFHRNLSHGSFKIPKWLEYFCAYCGLHALQGHPIYWVKTHRYHHKYVDTENDPHSPINGFWFSHVSWFLDLKTSKEKRERVPKINVVDLEKQFFYRFLRSTYMLHPIGLAILLYALGGTPFVIWGMFVRIVWVYHITWAINSVCHAWGQQPWNTGDLSKNNWWVGLLAFGEGWHNNHHAFEYSARHGLEWWQIDMTWYTIKFLETIGLATNVKLPTEAHKQRMAVKKE